MIGRILKERYKIVEEIGSGGMADVYRAYDQRLGRYVALKILKPELSQDREFIQRFQREAVNAARLSHPNIVNVYDIEEDDGLHFIVMEYIENAQNLKAYVTKLKKPITESDLIPILKDILKALSFAHQKGIIHRDLKPHNILITKDNIIKVTDFGIAKALYSDTLTQTGSLIGSVHYFSPEQAQGRPTTAPADIYSLGVLMFEILTGRLPFNGDNPVTIALKHVQEQPPKPSEFRRDISKDMERIVQKAMEKDPLMRYQNSEEMLAEFEKLAPGQPMKISHPAPTLLVPPSRKQKEIEVVSHHLRSRKEDLRDEEEPESRESSSFLRGVVTATLLIFLAASIIVAFLYGSKYLQEIETPDVLGKTISDAQTIITEKGLNMVIKEEIFSNDKPEGIVLKQTPDPGVKIKPGKKIYVTVSKGNKMVEVPDLVGVTLERGRQILDDRGLSKIDIKEDYSDDVPEGVIISQEPSPQNRVSLSTTIFLKVSRGPTKEKIPDLTGKTKEEALKILSKIHVKLSEEGTEPSSQIPAGRIIRQDPAPGTLLIKDSIVKVVLSKGMEGLASPNLVGKTIQEALAILEPLGINLKIEGDEKGQNAVITSQEPPAGELLEEKIIAVKAESIAIIPELIGKKLTDAKDLIVKRGFQVGAISFKEVSDTPADTVLEQDPQPGIEESQGVQINMIVAKSPTSPQPTTPIPTTPEPSPEHSPQNSPQGN